MNKSICFVGSNVYPVLTRSGENQYIGGESVQQTLLAKVFAQLGYQVSLVDHDYGQNDGACIDGIILWRTYKPDAGIPIFRFIHPKLTSILRSLKNADADMYYQSCAGMLTGVVAWFCRRHKRKFIFRTAHDTDCIRGQQLIKFWRDRKIYEYGIKHSDLIAVQGTKQRDLLKKYYNLEGVPVNMAVELPEDDANFDRNIDVLWVNNMRTFKRPEMALRLAKDLPNYKFVMVGGACPGFTAYYKEIEAEARVIPNLDFVGPVPYFNINSYFSRAKVFINTSTIEGFPNSFLQAWVRGVPVISFFDPDGLINSQKLGLVPSNFKEMVYSISDLLKSEDYRAHIGAIAQSFAVDRYSPLNVARRYVHLFKDF